MPYGKYVFSSKGVGWKMAAQGYLRCERCGAMIQIHVTGIRFLVLLVFLFLCLIAEFFLIMKFMPAVGLTWKIVLFIAAAMVTALFGAYLEWRHADVVTGGSAIAEEKHSLKRTAGIVILDLFLVYVGLVLCAYFFSDIFLFKPQPSSYVDTTEILKLTSLDGTKISAIHLSNPAAQYTILFSHGNSEDIGLLRMILEDIRATGFSVFSYDYHGYGTSPGKPSEESGYEDEEAAYRFLHDSLNVPSHRIIAHGRSLGGAVAVELAHRHSLGGLIIESSFVSAFRVLTHVSLLPYDKFNSIAKLRDVHCPVLVIHGKRDDVIPFWHGEKLFQEAHQPKFSLWVDSAGHNNLHYVAGNRYGETLHAFSRFLESREPSEYVFSLAIHAGKTLFAGTQNGIFKKTL